MKIAFIGLRGVPAEYGGVERAVEEIAVRLVEKGHDVTVYCMGGNYKVRLASYKGIRLRHIPTIRGKNVEMIYYAFLSALSSVRQEHDIIHFHSIGPSTLSWIPKIFGKRIVVTVHTLDWRGEKWGYLAKKYLTLGEWTSSHLPHSTIVVSKTLKRYYESKHKRVVNYIPNGVKSQDYSPLGESRERFGLEKNGYVLYVGRLTKDKKVDLLIEAFKKLDTRKKLVITGASKDDYMETLKCQASCDERIILTGPIYGDELARLYSNAYLFILPSAVEGLPMVVLEAMSHGSAVLVSDIAENLEVIDDEGVSRGATFHSGRIGSLASVLENLILNPRKIDHLRDKGKTLVARKYDWDEIVDATVKVYERVREAA